jgi:hypothetical protein
MTSVAIDPVLECILVDGTPILINQDHIDYIQIYNGPTPSGVLASVIHMAAGQDLIVLNSFRALRNVMAGGFTIVDYNAQQIQPLSYNTQTPTSVLFQLYPNKSYSTQLPPHFLIHPEAYATNTIYNSPDGMSGTFFLGNVVFYPYFILQSAANYVTDLTPIAPPPIDHFWAQSFNQEEHPGFDKLPFRNFDTNMSISTAYMDTSNYNHLTLGIP